MWWIHGASADAFYEIRPEYVDDAPKTRFRIKAGKTLSARKWRAAFTPDGYVDIRRTLDRIQRGGIHPSIRGEVWEFLLGCYDPNSTYDEREDIRQSRRLQYAKWKEECREMFPVVGSGQIITAPAVTEEGELVQDPLVFADADLDKVDSPPKITSNAELPEYDRSSTNSSNSEEAVREPSSCIPLDKPVVQWMLTLHQIGLDVVRTDRTLIFYEKQDNLAKLWDILAVYSWIDKDIGYCQGMSDLCSPMIILLDNEADAFWCFERLMRRLRGNFKCTERSLGVEAQLCNLAAITQVIDPKLHLHLETLGGGSYIFAFRMLMVMFRREFTFGDSMYLWEMMWALEYDPNLYSTYEYTETGSDKSEGSKERPKSIRQYGKFERENVRNKAKEADASLPVYIFIVASVLKDKSSKLMHEAKGLDDVVKILNDTNGNLDARKACNGALKLHRKYLRMARRHSI